MSLRGILFDFNGTLFFDSDMHIHLFQEYHREYGKPIPSADFIVANIFGRANATIIRENFKPDATDEEAEAFSREKERSAYLFADIPSDCVPAISPAAAKEIIFLCT